MENWDKVFCTGKHTDANGNVKDWTTEDLDKIVNSFNPSFHEPPVVIGHPSDNAPAFGWVSAIKRIGEDLYLSYKNVSSEFKEWVSKGLYKKKSIALYPDGSLRHVGYLGGMPPAIKGLPDFAFKGSNEFTIYEFSDAQEIGMWRRLKNWLIGKEGAEQAESIIPEYEMEYMARESYTPEKPEFKEGDIMKVEEVQELVKQAVTESSVQFSEQVKELKAEVMILNQRLLANRESELRREFKEFLETPEMQKRINEASRDVTLNQMMTLAGAEPVTFSENGEDKKMPAVEYYKQQLSKLPEIIQFGEFAAKDKAADITINGMSPDEIAKKAVEFQQAEKAAGRTISMTEAVNHVKKGGK